MKVWSKILMVFASIIVLGISTAEVNQGRNVAGETIGGSQYPAEYFYDNKVIVLMYHHIDPFFKSGATITPELFHQQMAMLKEKHFNVISMKQFDSFQKGKGSVPPNAVVITFDDGYESFYKYAYPELKKWNFPATNFVIVACTDSPYLSHLPHLKWPEIKEMQANGMSFMSHTYNQHDYVVINPGGFKKPVLLGPSYIEEEARKETQKNYEDRVKADLSLAKKRLEEELGEPQNAICFPYGAYNETVLSIAQSLGMDTFFTISPGINTSGNRLIYRINGGSPKISAEDLLNSIRHYASPENNGVVVSPPVILIKVNGTLLTPTQPPFRKENKLYVPFRGIAEALGAKVSWDQRSQTVTAQKGDKTLILKAGSAEAEINGSKVQLDHPLENEESSLMVPLRLVVESFGATIKWDNAEQSVLVSAP